MVCEGTVRRREDSRCRHDISVSFHQYKYRKVQYHRRRYGLIVHHSAYSSEAPPYQQMPVFPDVFDCRTVGAQRAETALFCLL